ncbi:deoxyribose-phosphate aldolase [Xylariaceae sp. FL1272]|nr:deoxyribose-phosphate aldolase [Xylariaceae sp. FL1272]
METSLITTSLPQIAKLIDHSLLHPTLTDSEIHAGLKLARDLQVAAACVKPYSVPIAKEVLDDTGVAICAVVGFPHGNSTTGIKVLEAEQAVKDGATEIDMVVNIGKVLGADWEYVQNEIKDVNEKVTRGGALLKVIFENDYLSDERCKLICRNIIHLSKICSILSVAYVKTSTGYGFVKQSNGSYSYEGATTHHLKLMKENVGPSVRIKAAGGIRTLHEVLVAMSLGVSRIGATATKAILDEAAGRGIGTTPVQIALPRDWN